MEIFYIYNTSLLRIQFNYVNKKIIDCSLQIMEGDDDSTGYSVGRSPSNYPRSACSPNSSCSNDPVDMSFMMIDYLKDAMKVFF